MLWMQATKKKMKTKQPFKIGDIIEFENNYYGLIVKAAYVNDSIYLKVLNTNGNVRQLNLMYAESHFYSYNVINV